MWRPGVLILCVLCVLCVQVIGWVELMGHELTGNTWPVFPVEHPAPMPEGWSGRPPRDN